MGLEKSIMSGVRMYEIGNDGMKTDVINCMDAPVEFGKLLDRAHEDRAMGNPRQKADPPWSDSYPRGMPQRGRPRLRTVAPLRDKATN